MDAFNVFIDDTATWIFSNRKTEEINILAKIFGVQPAPTKLYWPYRESEIKKLFEKTHGFIPITDTEQFGISDCYARIWVSKKIAQKVTGDS